jgi:hypothetical protein
MTEHIVEARMWAFAIEQIEFSEEEDAHFDECAECRTKLRQIVLWAGTINEN